MDYKKYDGVRLKNLKYTPEKNKFGWHFFEGFDGDEIYVDSDGDNRNDYFIDTVWFAESFTSEGDIIRVFNEYK